MLVVMQLRVLKGGCSFSIRTTSSSKAGWDIRGLCVLIANSVLWPFPRFRTMQRTSWCYCSFSPARIFVSGFPWSDGCVYISALAVSAFLGGAVPKTEHQIWGARSRGSCAS